MSLLDDPMMKEIVDEFCDEAADLFTQLEDILDEIEDHPDKFSVGLEQFGQIIDRVMGAAKSIGVDEVAKFCELGKIIGYKSSQVTDKKLQEIAVAVMFDTVDLLIKMNEKTRTGSDSSLKNLSTKTFPTRLHWLSEKFKDIDRASCSFDEKQSTDLSKEEDPQQSIDDLLNDLGL
ncbi:MAG: hypothetical protein HOE90_07690 [Bacteriovoracaceae bacterium]|jgi:chemotaxis protein histidine kinase CheA|nr:hypothetical protein [Bacteriovoracaceae bacterium]